jgi:hypothetical protein
MDAAQLARRTNEEHAPAGCNCLLCRSVWTMQQGSLLSSPLLDE